MAQLVGNCHKPEMDESSTPAAGRRRGAQYDRTVLRDLAARMGSRRPNLFVVGAPRCGTTSLHHFLGTHPSIFMSDLKEPGFFVPELEAYPKDPEWYLGLFEGADDEAYVGESSTHYAKLPNYPGVPERIAECCDDPRFLYLMRNPIDRAISNYWHSTRQNAEFRSPLEAIEENGKYQAFGDYERQLTPYLDRFGRDAVFVETFERMISDPEAVTSEIYRWLGLDPAEASAEFPTKNATPNNVERFEGGQVLGEFLHDSRLWDRLSPLIPQFLKDLGHRVTRSKVDPSEQPLDDVREHLRPWAEDVVERTSRLLGQDFPEWSVVADGGA